MKKLPEELLRSLQNLEGFNEETFVNVHESNQQVTSIRINPAKVNSRWSIGNNRPPIIGDLIHHSPFTIHQNVPWSSFGFYLQERPSFTFDPLFHAGCYYVQEASSMFLEQAFKQLVDLSQPLKVLDLCAAPGGKSTHIQSIISSESLLVCNEVIKSRSTVLIDNLVKWGRNNVVVTNNDPSAFQKLEGYFDVMVVDAPCSGSGLFRKDEEAIDEWSLNNVMLCSQRQQRILADALPALKENGLLIYSTCSYSKEEDEDIADWLVGELKIKNEKLEIKESWNIVETSSSKTNSNGYRFYPDKVKGEGLFLSCFRKETSSNNLKIRPSKVERANANEKNIIKPFFKNPNIEFIKENNSFFAIPFSLMNDYAVLKSLLNIKYRGTGVGQIMKDKLIPEHSLALSTIISDEIPSNELTFEQAIKYLQRQDLNFNTSGKGWQLVCYKGQNLGWINALPNRINNYYPKELRILKQDNRSSFEK